MRNEILSVAKNLFHKQGLENTSIEEISKCAGYNAGELQRIYTSEYDLFFEVVTTDAAEFVAHLQNHVKGLPHISQQITTYLDKKNAYYLDVISRNKISKLTLNAILPQFFQIYEEIMNEEITFLAQLLQAAIVKKQIEIVNTRQLAFSILKINSAAMHHAERGNLLSTNAPDYQNMRQAVDFMLQQVIKGLTCNHRIEKIAQLN